MSTITIDIPEALDLLRLAVEENGADYIDPSIGLGDACKYLHGDEPGCIVGNVMCRLGVVRDQIRQFEGEGAYDLGQSRKDVPWRTEGGEKVVFTDSAAELLDVAQCRQDNGDTWGAARDAAELYARDGRR